MKSSLSSVDRSRGFTLLEALIALAISGVALSICAGFLVDAARVTFVSEEKLNINGDIRNLTNELLDLGRSADRFYVYDSYSSAVYAPSSGVYGDARLGDGQSGDFLVLVFEGASTSSFSGYPVTEMVGIYRDADSSNEGPVKMWHLQTVSSSEEYLTPEEIMPTLSEIATVEAKSNPSPSDPLTLDTIVELAEGQANGNLFYNFKDRSVMVNGKIIHGNDAKMITDTYNMTIKPRGGQN